MKTDRPLVSEDEISPKDPVAVKFGTQNDMMFEGYHLELELDTETPRCCKTVPLAACRLKW